MDEIIIQHPLGSCPNLELWHHFRILKTHVRHYDVICSYIENTNTSLSRHTYHAKCGKIQMASSSEMFANTNIQGVQYQKNVPNTKSLLNWFICKITDTNSNQRLIYDFRCVFQSILFLYVQFCKQGECSKCFIFKWLAHKNFKRKMIFFVLLANMECCYQSVKILEEMIRSKYQRATPEFPVFFITRCLKMHNWC